MQAAEQLRWLQELAGEAGLRVRRIAGGGRDGEPAAASAVCRVRGEIWVVLSSADSVEEQVAVLAAALRDFAPEWLEQRYLPPALRARLGGPDEPA